MSREEIEQPPAHEPTTQSTLETTLTNISLLGYRHESVLKMCMDGMDWRAKLARQQGQTIQDREPGT